MQTLFAAALLVLSVSTDFASAQGSINEDKTRTPPKYYPTEFQITGSDSGAASNAFMLDQNARLFYCYVRPGDPLICSAPVQLPQFTTPDFANPAPQPIKYFMSPTHKSGSSDTMIVSSFGQVRRCYFQSTGITCSSPVSLKN